MPVSRRTRPRTYLHHSNMFHTSFVCVSLCLGYLITHTSPQPSSTSLSTEFTTTSLQYSYLNIIPLSYFLNTPRSYFTFSKSKSLWLLIFIILSGDIQLNPGPISNVFNVCTINIRSLQKPLNYAAVADLAVF